jgi:polysaccharide pyruvyl transferase WcaK-like protein
MIISIFASIWAQNLWDELILKNEIKILEDEYWKDTQFIVFSYDYKNPFFKKSNITYREYFPVWIKNISNFLKNIYNFFSFLNVVIKSDLIVIGWWGIIYDSEIQSTKDPLDQWIFRVNIFKFFMKKISFFAIWINIKDKFNLHKVKKIFLDASNITVRDKYSFNLLHELWIASTIVKDPVFSDNLPHPLTPSLVRRGNSPKNYMIKKVKSTEFNFKDLEDIDLEWKKIAIAFRKWYLSDKVEKLGDKFEEWKINELINYILKKWWEVILLPHSFHKTDSIANDYVFLSKFLRLNEKIRIISSIEDVYSKYIYKEMDLCLAMRLHSIILSQVYEIPFIWVSYSTKTDEVLENIEKTFK